MDKSKAIRVAYGQKLAELGEHNKNIIVLDADVSSSTQSHYFAKAHPDRFYNFGIAEANMVSAAAGLATMGKVPVVNTFSFLLCERALDQITRGIAYNSLNVKLAANYGGMSDSFDGASHHSTSDIAIMSTIPNVTTVVISDAVQMEAALPKIIDYDGCVYFRMCRAVTPIVHTRDDEFEIGKGIMLKGGKDITIAATGIMVARALEAADLLKKDGIDARVVEIHTIKPIDKALIQQCAQETGAIVTCEEGLINGGLGSAVCRCIQENPVPVDRVGIDDCFTQTGPYETLLDHYGMGVDSIINRVKQLYLKKR